MVLNNIEITVADCLLNLGRTDEIARNLPPKKRIYDLKDYQDRSKRFRMTPIESNQFLDGYNGIVSQHLFLGNLSPQLNFLSGQLPRPSPTMLRVRDTYPVGYLPAQPFPYFRNYQPEHLLTETRRPHILNAKAVSTAVPVGIEAEVCPVTPGNKTSVASESVEDAKYEEEEESGSASVISESSVNDSVTNEKELASVVEDSDVEPTSKDVLIGTGRTCSGHAGNKRFHREIYECCEEYFGADYKKGIVERIIHRVHNRGGRFLSKTKTGPWRPVSDMDRLERNTRKSFHMAKKQKQKESQISTSSKKLGTASNSNPRELAQQVAVYVPEVSSFCIGWMERKDSNGNIFVRFNDRRLGADWFDMTKTDVRVLSR